MKNSNKVFTGILVAFLMTFLAGCDATWDDLMKVEVTDEQWNGGSVDGGDGGDGGGHG